MTQMVRWLTALALLLAFGACTVRAEEEDYEGVAAAEADCRRASCPRRTPCPWTCPLLPIVSPVAWSFQFLLPTVPLFPSRSSPSAVAAKPARLALPAFPARAARPGLLMRLSSWWR